MVVSTSRVLLFDVTIMEQDLISHDLDGFVDPLGERTNLVIPLVILATVWFAEYVQYLLFGHAFLDSSNSLKDSFVPRPHRLNGRQRFVRFGPGIIVNGQLRSGTAGG